MIRRSPFKHLMKYGGYDMICERERFNCNTTPCDVTWYDGQWYILIYITWLTEVLMYALWTSSSSRMSAEKNCCLLVWVNWLMRARLCCGDHVENHWSFFVKSTRQVVFKMHIFFTWCSDKCYIYMWTQ